MKTAIKRVMTYLYWLYYQYKLITCSDLMVPCEKFVFYAVIVPMTAAVMYMIYIFITVQINLAFQVFLLLFGGLPESAVSIMK